MNKLSALIIIPFLSFSQIDPSQLCDSIFVSFIEYNELEAYIEIEVSTEFTTSYSYPYAGFILTNDDGDIIASETLETAPNVYGLGGNMFEIRFLQIIEGFAIPTNSTIHLVNGLFAGTAEIICSWDFNTSACQGDLGLLAYPSDACPGSNNGLINLYPSGGTPPYTYLWSNGETSEDLANLASGEYSVTVTDANGVCDVISAEILEYSAISFYQSPTCPYGSDGMVYFNSTGCDCNVSFCQWIWEFNGDTIAQGDGSSAAETYKYLFNIESGTYTATIIHPDGCQLQQTITVPEAAIIDNSYISNECESNNNGFIDLIVSPSDSTIQNYLWNTGDVTQDLYNLSAGSYSVVINDTICSDTLYFEIENILNYNNQIFTMQDSIITLANGIDTLELNTDENCEFIISSYFYGENPSNDIFSWTLSGGVQGEWNNSNECENGDWCIVNNPPSGITILFEQEGIYTLNMYSDMNGAENCTNNGSEIDIIVMNPCNQSIMDPLKQTNIYTDSDNNLVINMPSHPHEYRIEIFNINGQKIIDSKLNKTNNLSLNNYQSGIYTIRLLLSDFIYTKKIIIN